MLKVAPTEAGAYRVLREGGNRYCFVTHSLHSELERLAIRK